MKEHRNRDGDPNPDQRTPRWAARGAMHRVPSDEPNGFRRTGVGNQARVRHRSLGHAWISSPLSSPPRNPSLGVRGWMGDLSLGEANARFR